MGKKLLQETLATTDAKFWNAGVALCIRTAGMAHCIWSVGVTLCNQSAGMALCTLQSATSAQSRQMDQNRKFWPGESISLRNFTPVVCKVFPKDLLLVLATPQPKILIWSFWLWYDQMVLLTGVRPEPMLGFFEVRPFDLERLRTFTPMVPKVSRNHRRMYRVANTFPCYSQMMYLN